MTHLSLYKMNDEFICYCNKRRSWFPLGKVILCGECDKPIPTNKLSKNMLDYIEEPILTVNMILDQIIQAKQEFTREELEEMVKKTVADMDNMVNDLGSAIILANNLGVQIKR